ncbi:rhodanese-like domain-containing protein [Candidatus Enterococcus ferrettii]|uniref:Rhodanese domain-containing protein n=1 Tax=Candidatus Enterococcus ferrettii TaxID=2815324 RepID=A0ABV0EVD7_9ENTE|nr:rhodanese-like domain-containing protein [Enterococcus sp. 665A]MBO1342034.1 rhodanese-like domain-containing protein [Enterococcus sp. 665A]
MNHSITIQEFLALANKQNVHILDLRDPAIYDTTDLTSFTRVERIPLTQLVNQFTELDKAKTYYLFSQFGDDSDTMTSFLEKRGYHVVNVIGGATAFCHYLAS